ncbi:MAG: hypothetical protein ABFS30_06820, partial [Pseudomonadota bacterium]
GKTDPAALPRRISAGMTTRRRGGAVSSPVPVHAPFRQGSRVPHAFPGYTAHFAFSPGAAMVAGLFRGENRYEVTVVVGYP